MGKQQVWEVWEVCEDGASSLGVGGWGRNLSPHTPHTSLPPHLPHPHAPCPILIVHNHNSWQDKVRA
ncbi:hypothetical protein [Nostoc sp. DSM 114161]|uniref:hypothetical protein n=1 Tax=Nostoc sp. DSM 114161 TaxID=3440143 RepID=UPI0040454AE2